MNSTEIDKYAIGEVHCLNCGRSLARVIEPPGGGFRLLPTNNQSAVHVIVAGRRLLRCQRCGGRAFVELRDDTLVEQATPEEMSTIGGSTETARPAPRDRVAPVTRWRVGSGEGFHRSVVAHARR
jgi:DNA-directed RNA polymerase subunit RPC12/RpoP